MGEPITRNWSDIYGNTGLYLIPNTGQRELEFPQNAIASSSSYGINSSQKFTHFDPHRPLYLAQTEPTPSEEIEIPVIPPTDLVEVTAAEQEFDQQRQIITV
ncbi:hypothetical protein AB3M80_28490 [Arthrospira platensis BEA 1257B]